MSDPRPGEIVQLGRPLPWEFIIVVRNSKRGPEVRRVPADDADVADALAEMWRDGFLRRGWPDVAFDDVSIRIRVPPGEGADDDDGDRDACFVLEADTPDGESVRRVYPKEAFRDAALVAAQDELAAKLVAGEGSLALCFYDVVARRREDSTSTLDDVLRVENRSAPLAHVSVPLGPLRTESTVCGELDEDEEGIFPVFYTRDAFEKAERFARRGAGAQPPAETGAVLIGWLASCPESGEFFVVVEDALEATDAEGSKFSLAYTGKTWSRIQTIVAARQRRAGTRAVRILGQCHGHNFVPGGGEPPCADCHKLAVCSRSSVFASADDRTWSRAVFAKQPWHLCHIFGLNARQEKIHGLFTLAGNRLVERGFRILDREFSPPAPRTTTG